MGPSQTLPGACLDSLRETMRLLVNLLGIRSEHNRNDRNSFLTFTSGDPNAQVMESLQRYSLFLLYNSSTTAIASTFDYQSVTLVTGDKFAASSNAPVFVANTAIGQLARLSRTDCLLTNMLYRCNSACPDRKWVVEMTSNDDEAYLAQKPLKVKQMRQRLYLMARTCVLKSLKTHPEALLKSWRQKITEYIYLHILL